MTESAPLIFGFDREPPSRLGRLSARTAAGPIERLFGLSTLQHYYASTRRAMDGGSVKRFLDIGLSELDVELVCKHSHRERIPPEGPVVVVANHPFGGLEGMLLAQLLLTGRDDVRVLANYMLEPIPDMREILILVDPWARTGSRGRNARALKETLRHVQGGGMVAVFPAGEVAHRSFFDGGQLRESRWRASIGRIIQRAGAPILPVYFCGENSLAFQLAGMVHPMLRTALLPREMLNKCGRRIEVRVGHRIDAAEVRQTDAAAFAAYLQARTEQLKHRVG
ncbi:MAG: lysophospholipid acyltransferase family protein [Myxococcales bacterium]|nr:lysophospholipid acyltransferase family protein [Myxococcales bacterium]